MDIVVNPRTSTEVESPNRARKWYELKAGDSLTGKIVAIEPSFTCEFPNDTTSVVASGVGINLNGFLSRYQAGIKPILLDKISITSGTCLVYVE